MKKKYVVEFQMANNSTEVVEFITDNVEWSIEQWSRNRVVTGHVILEESSTSSAKKMLLG